MDNNTGKPTVNNGKRRFPMKNEYAKIGLMLFIVVAGSILFYFSFFKDHTLFGFSKAYGHALCRLPWARFSLICLSLFASCLKNGQPDGFPI